MTPSNPASGTNEAAERLRQWAMDVVRSVPSVPIHDTDAVPTFKRRVTACIDRAAVLLALRHAEPPPVATERAIGAALDVDRLIWANHMASGGAFMDRDYAEEVKRFYDTTFAQDAEAAEYRRLASETPRPGEMQEANREMEADLWNSDR